MKSSFCELVPPQIQPQNQGPLTVGQYLYLSCQPITETAAEAGGVDNSEQERSFADWSQWDLKSIRFKLNSEDTEFVKIFSAEAEAATGRLIIKMTLYKAGPQPLEELSVTDGNAEVSLQGEPIEIKSVIQPPADGQQVKPFGPVLPLTLSTPVSYYVVFLLSLLALGLFIVLQLRRISYERALKNKLRDYQSPLAPDAQIYRAIRLAEKVGYPIADLEKAFKLYLLRRFELPIFDLTESSAMRYFKRRWPHLKELRLSAYKILTELTDLQKKDEVRAEDQANTLSLIRKIYKFIESTESRAEELAEPRQRNNWLRGPA